MYYNVQESVFMHLINVLVEEKMRVVICDDDIRDAEEARHIIENMTMANGFEIKIKTPQELRLLVEEELFECDVLVIDIMYEDEKYDGIELTRLINEKLPACQVIYLTNILDFAPMVYDTNHCYFVLKDNREIMLPRAMEKAIDASKTACNEVIEFLSNGHKVFMSQNEIVYIERDDRVLEIHTLKKTYPCYMSLKKIEDKLSTAFARCHGGFIVNISFVSGIEGNELYLKDGNKLPIGMRFYDDFKLKYLKYYTDRM